MHNLTQNFRARRETPPKLLPSPNLRNLHVRSRCSRTWCRCRCASAAAATWLGLQRLGLQRRRGLQRRGLQRQGPQQHALQRCQRLWPFGAEVGEMLVAGRTAPAARTTASAGRTVTSRMSMGAIATGSIATSRRAVYRDWQYRDERYHDEQYRDE